MNTKCKYCEQTPSQCPCARVDAFFNDTVGLTINWPKETEQESERKAS